MAQTAMHGNLLSYKLYTRPKAQAAYGHGHTKTARQRNAQHILGVLAENGMCSTWEMAKVRMLNDLEGTREKEKDFRRIISGRRDRGRHSPGMSESGLITSELVGNSRKYRLTPHGILYCIDSLRMSDAQIDMMAAAYVDVLPRVFGRWEHLKETLGDGAYRIRTLACGLLLDNPAIRRDATSPIYELMSYIQLKYHRSFEVMREESLAEQVAYWYYTCILYDSAPSAKRASRRLRMLREALGDMHAWYSEFVKEADAHYRQRAHAIGAAGI